MNVHPDLERLPVFKDAVITIGTFDGVHTGHQLIVGHLKEEAKRTGGETVLITFHPHPRKVLGDAAGEIKLINTLNERTELLSATGIDHLVVVPFTEAFSRLSALDYIQHFLIDRFHPHTIIIGYDHRFGMGRRGDFHLLEECSDTFHYALKEIPVHLLNEASVSSTRIRDAILQTDMETANRLLGYDFFFEGTVVEGNRLGRTLGYPTANLKIEDPEKIMPGNGAYAVQAAVLSPGARPVLIKGMMNIGFRPTIQGTVRTVEVNLFDFEEDLYGRSLRVHIRQFLRREQKFDGLEGLKKQLSADKASALQALQPTRSA